jgi:putative PIN family toxin of toxin-antitoxin system
MRIVVDTNVWISGLLLPKSDAGKIIQGWKTARYQIIISKYILEEIGRVLTYPKIQKRLGWNQIKIRHYLDTLAFFTEMVENNEITVTVKADPKDSPILSTLVNSSSAFLITGDTDLLELKEKYPIVSISEFLRILEE